MSRKKKRNAEEISAAENTANTGAPEQNEKQRRTRRRVTYILLYVAAFAFIIYAVISLIGINSQIRERRAELDEIKGEIKVQEIKNEEMNKMYNYTDDEFSDYVEQIARDDLDYVKSGERVFVNVSGD